jgi:hypothetical protein
MTECLAGVQRYSGGAHDSGRQRCRVTNERRRPWPLRVVAVVGFELPTIRVPTKIPIAEFQGIVALTGGIRQAI